MNKSNDTHEILGAEWVQFQSAWQNSRAGWNDVVTSEFEKRFIRPMQADIPAFLAALESLNDDLKSAQRELR